MKSRKLAAVLALLGSFSLPGIHRFYLGQSRWGIVYVLLAWQTPISRVASVVEAVWYLFMDDVQFDWAFNQGPALEAAAPVPRSTPKKPLDVDPTAVGAIAEAVRQLEKLRQEGLLTEAEFEQKRRKLLDQIG